MFLSFFPFFFISFFFSALYPLLHLLFSLSFFSSFLVFFFRFLHLSFNTSYITIHVCSFSVLPSFLRYLLFQFFSFLFFFFCSLFPFFPFVLSTIHFSFPIAFRVNSFTIHILRIQIQTTQKKKIPPLFYSSTYLFDYLGFFSLHFSCCGCFHSVANDITLDYLPLGRTIR